MTNLIASDLIRQQLESITPVSRETWAQLETYVAMLLEESSRQNLIAASTWDDVWERHILDSAQLVGIAHQGVAAQSGPVRHWLDIGSGAGLPGIVIAVLTQEPIVMVEPRRMRVDFLLSVIERLGLRHASAVLGKAERLPATQIFDVITARAVAPLPALWQMAAHIADDRTLWVLPKGKNAINELDEARQSWQGKFSIVPSLTSAEAAIIVGRQVKPQRQRGRSQ